MSRPFPASARPACWCLGALLALAQGTPARQLASFLPGDAAISAAAGDQSSPFLAAGGGTLLAVWSDNRANSTGGYEGETSRDIYGIRIDGNGSLLEAVPFAVAAGPASQESPKAAWNGTCWLVAYESLDAGGTGYPRKCLQATRVAADGRVLDASPIRTFALAPTFGDWAVASDGAGWVIAGQGTALGSEIAAVRIAADGTVLDDCPRVLVPGTYYLRSNFRLAQAGGVFLLSYDEMATGSSSTSALRFDASLAPLDPAPTTLLPHPVLGLASNGGGFCAAWNEQLPDYTMAVKGSRIGINGQLLDGNGVSVSGSNPPQSYTTTSVTWDGSAWKITWGATSGLRVARMDSAGRVLDAGGVPVPGLPSGLSASAGNGSVQLLWSAQGASTNDIRTARVSAANAAGAVRDASLGSPAQLQADVAAGASGFMLVHRSVTSSTVRILAQPLDAAGAATLAEPVQLDSGSASSSFGAPAVAWNGSAFLVAWQSPSGVVARRLLPDGTPLDAAPFVILSSAFGAVDVEALDGTFLVAGLRCGISCQYVFPVAARVRGSDGMVLDASPIGLSGTFASSPRVVALGGRWLVAWQDNASHDESMASTVGAFVDASGVKAREFSFHGPYSTAGGNGIFSLGLASSGTVALLVQSQELTSGVENDLLFRLVDSSGAVQPAVNLTPWADDQYRPRAAWDGTRFVVVFQDQKTALTSQGLEQLDARSDLVGMRISPAGVVLDPQGFVLSNGARAEAFPTVACLAGTTLVAGSLLRDDASNASYRVACELLGGGGDAWPVAVASASPAGGDVPLTVGFSSSGSIDPDGAIVARAWDFGDGATSSDADPTHLYLAGGPHLVQLAVTDDRGATSVQELLVRDVLPNVPPVARASSSTLSGPVPYDAVFETAGSCDADGFLGNVEWSFGDGGTSYGSPAYHTFYEQGVYPVTMTVHDARGGTGHDTLTVTVGPPNPPAAPGELLPIAFTSSWINMTWRDNSNNEDGFIVERCPGSVSTCNAHPSLFAEIARTGRNVDYHGDTDLPAGTTFTYRVRAFNVTASSAWSSAAAATTHPPPPDSDGDGLADDEETQVHRTNPAKADTDGGGRPDGHEVAYGLDPLHAADDFAVLPDFALGDVGGGASGPDGAVNSADVVKLLRLAIGIDAAAPEQLLRGDVSPAAVLDVSRVPRRLRRVGDRVVDVMDVVETLRLAVGLDAIADR